MKSTKILALLVLVAMCFTMLASCGIFNKGHEHNFVEGKCECGETDPNYQPDNGDKPYVPKQAEYNTTTSVMPSNWNEFTYSDNNDTQILSYISSSFFDYDYAFDGDKYNADGSINSDAIISGGFTVNYSAATKLEDVTASVDAKWGYTDKQKEDGGYAWKITLRDDLKWDDGTPITAADFEYSMEAILNSDFMNFRANTYYDTLMVKGAKNYFYSGAPIYADAFDWDTEELLSEGPFFVKFSAGWSGNPNYSIEWMYNNGYIFDKDAVEDDPATPDVDETAPAVLGATYYEELDELADEYGYIPVTGNEEKLAVMLNQFLAAFGIPAEAASVYYPTFYLYFTGEYGEEYEWDTVGCYAIPEENAIVICLDKTYSFLTEDGDLALWAGYYMSSLPLVKKDLYESCKQEPAEGATLWTSNYNSSLETTASWGPYMLAEFESGSHYRLVKNPYWFGWNMEEYKNQYNITAINCRKVSEPQTQWMGFLAGQFDDSSVTSDNYAEYGDSKYAAYQGDTGTFGMQLYSNLGVLKNGTHTVGTEKVSNNNGILSILEFRQAFNLATNRNEIVEKIWPGSTVPCFGLVNTQYYYDVENAPYLDDGGIYRNNPIAKAGILRAYGYTQGEDGLWSINEDLKNLTLDEAYETLTGYNLDLAKVKLQEAIDILTADPDHYGYDETLNITFIFGSSVDNDKQRFRAQYLQEVLDKLTAGSILEDKIDIIFDASAGSKWADAFRSGATQIGFGYGFSGNAFNPFDIVGAFVDPDDSLNYHAYWDTSIVDMTLTMPEGSYEGAGETITMSLQNWYFCLNGLAKSEGAPKEYNWGEGFAPVEARLTILAALEEAVINQSCSIMLIGDAGGSFLGAKFAYFSTEYNTFMGFGGLRYMEVVYNDVEWTNFVKANNNDLSNEYKKSE